jgi:hypothetical protein
MSSRIFQSIEQLLQLNCNFERVNESDIEEKINLQKDGNNANPYQVKQVRAVILEHELGGEK